MSDSLESKFEKGHTVGLLAQQLFPNGIDLQKKYQFDYDKSIEEVRELLNQTNAIIYEAPFLYNEVLSVLDILVCENGKITAYEVKSITEIKEHIILECALQYWVMKNSSIEISDFNIVYVNNKYVKQGELDINELFKIESVLERILPLQDDISSKVEELKEILNNQVVPEIDINSNCDHPNPCDFHNHCWQHIPKYSIFNIAYLKTPKKFELYKNGIVKFNDIPKDYPLNENQWQQVDCELNKTSIINKPKLKEFLDSLNYPLYFMDFESFQPVIPMFDNSRPYQQITSQYSLHYLESKDSELKHFEYLAEANYQIDPRIGFIEQLIDETLPDGDILIFNISFEKPRLNEIAKDFPQYAEAIGKIISRLKDLIIPFREHYYFTPEMLGKFSIKNVLSALIPELSYKELEISNGGMAMTIYPSLYLETDQEKINTVRHNLLKYCEMDTFAMVRILKVLEGIN
ncbi:MAG: DUF2779 domain-containing protein [Candidatus Kapabacteria bacterium]|nr:DUF2779 domain-containing protein [Candidatus Kapabacteria bacterium]